MLTPGSRRPMSGAGQQERGNHTLTVNCFSEAEMPFPGRWPEPRPSHTVPREKMQAMSPGGMLVVMMDGSVRSVSTSISTATLARAIVPNDGLPLGDDWNQ